MYKRRTGITSKEGGEKKEKTGVMRCGKKENDEEERQNMCAWGEIKEKGGSQREEV